MEMTRFAKVVTQYCDHPVTTRLGGGGVDNAGWLGSEVLVDVE